MESSFCRLTFAGAKLHDFWWLNNETITHKTAFYSLSRRTKRCRASSVEAEDIPNCETMNTERREREISNRAKPVRETFTLWGYQVSFVIKILRLFFCVTHYVMNWALLNFTAIKLSLLSFRHGNVVVSVKQAMSQSEGFMKMFEKVCETSPTDSVMREEVMWQRANELHLRSFRATASRAWETQFAN